MGGCDIASSGSWNAAWMPSPAISDELAAMIRHREPGSGVVALQRAGRTAHGLFFFPEAGAALDVGEQKGRDRGFFLHRPHPHSTVTALARLRGLSTSVPRASAV